MGKFKTFNQFDDRFKGMSGFQNQRNACPIFALLTAYYFMKDAETTQSRHENILETAVNIVIEHNELPKFMNFYEIIQFYDGYHDNQVKATTPEMINQIGYINFDDEDASMFRFPGFPMNYAVVILKNSNFFVVLVKFTGEGNSYHVRDCHEKEQHNFENFETLVEHLNRTYQLNELTVVDGVFLPEYSNIEYLRLDEPFKVKHIDPSLANPDDQDVSEQSPDSDFGITVDFSSVLGGVSDSEEDTPSSPPSINVNQIVGGDLDEDEKLAFQLQMKMWQEMGMM